MNLYAILPADAPANETELVLAKDDAEAMDYGLIAAAQDNVNGYCSAHAQVFLVATDLRKVGDAVATDAPAWWKWAHPAVEENAAYRVCDEVERAVEDAGQDS